MAGRALGTGVTRPSVSFREQTPGKKSRWEQLQVPWSKHDTSSNPGKKGCGRRGKGFCCWCTEEEVGRSRPITGMTVEKGEDGRWKRYLFFHRLRWQGGKESDSPGLLPHDTLLAEIEEGDGTRKFRRRYINNGGEGTTAFTGGEKSTAGNRETTKRKNFQETGEG